MVPQPARITEGNVIKEIGPVVIEQYPVRLEGISDYLSGLSVSFLQFDNFAEKIDAHQRGLAPLPAENILLKAKPERFLNKGGEG